MSSLVFVAYPADDPSGTPLGVLTEAADKGVIVEADAAGSGRFTINRHSSQLSWTEPGNYIRCRRDTSGGALLAGFWIEDSGEDLVSPDEEGGEDVERSGQGPIACLEEAIIWHRAYRGGLGRVRRRAGVWAFRRRGGFQVVRVLIRLIREAKARGAIPFVTLTFTSTHDSDGEPWPDETEVRRFTVPIGPTETELVTMLRAKGLRIEMDADFALSAWPEDRENDLSGSIELEVGVDIRDDLERERKVRRVRSHALVGGDRKRGGERYVPVASSVILAELGRRKEGFRDIGRTASRGVLRRTGRRSLRKWRRLKDGSASVPVIDTTGQVALVDFRPGDTVTLTVPGIYSTGQVIEAISLVETEGGEYDPVIEFGGLIPDPDSGEDWSDDAATAARS